MKSLTINSRFSTTRLVTQQQQQIDNNPSAKIQSRLFLPHNSVRKGEGGLRTKGYFKCSYDKTQTITEIEKPQKLNSTSDRLLCYETNEVHQHLERLQRLSPKISQAVAQNFPLPLVTIITVVFNGEKYLEQTIQSVLQQTYSNIEYIIIDGSSTDNTLNIIQKYEAVIDYWISEPDQGIYDAMNKGIQLATGQIIGLLNSGDLYTKKCIQRVVNLFNQNQFNDKLIISGAMWRFDWEQKIKFKLIKKQEDVTKINQKMSLNHPATFVSKKVYEIVGLFNTSYKICGDYDFILRAYHNQEVDFVVTDSVFTHMMLGGISEQPKSLITRCHEQFSLRKDKINILKNIFYTILWLTNTLLKQSLKKYFGNNLLLKYYYNLRHPKIQ
jgi:glycosyltransferase involved in cell wall biosynthesis